MIEQLVAVRATTAEWLWKVANTNFMIAFLSASAALQPARMARSGDSRKK